MSSTKGILTVSLNAAVDVAYQVDNFEVNQINTVRELTRIAGGKANNVARVLASLGQKVIATGFAGGTAGQFIQDDLRNHGITVDYESFIDGENRTCTAIVDQVGRTLTEVREKGPTLTELAAEGFMDRFRRLVPRAEMVVISGSLPPGIPDDFYGRLVAESYRITQARTILDATGPALSKALWANPYLVKPNLEELAAWAGTALGDDAAILDAARRLQEAGPLVVAVSLGAEGLLVVAPEGSWRAIPPKVQPVNTVGSGDSLVAGFAVGVIDGLAAEDVLRLAVACGTANALTESVAVVRPDDLAWLRAQVRVERIA